MRPTLFQTYMRTAELFAERSTCSRAKIGAVLVKDGRIISTGYTGSPSNRPHCLDVGCQIDPVTKGCVRTLHAEANAIAQAAKAGISTAGTILFTTVSPCLSCAKLIVSAGIKTVFYLNKYRDTSGIDFLRLSDVQCEESNGE